nr:nucleotidyl transferase AbiEii/AbiGii toxin family protein [Bradyrhizobium diazoefficiens]
MSAQSDWAQLFRIACAMIRQVNAEQNIIDCWTFGGGTAMMLQIDHRMSHDVDIFLPDPQALPFLDPQKHDFDFEIRPVDYKGDGTRLLKLGFGFGEIDFIVAPSLTSSPTTRAIVEGEVVLLETIPESLRRRSITGAIASRRATYLTLRRAAKSTQNLSSTSLPAIATTSLARWPQSIN